MKKNSLMILMLLLITACSQKEPEVTPQVKKDVKKDMNNTTTPQVTHTRMEIKHESVATTQSHQVPTEVPPVVQEEFVPEHIRRSHIEVVEHY